MEEQTATSQISMILDHLEKHGSITSREAMDEYGIMRLSARIKDLKKLYEIGSKREKGVNRYGKTVSYSRYYLEETT